MSTLPDLGLERRGTPRTAIESLTYISFGSNNQGIVLDISEGGLRFRVLSPIREKEQPLHFWFSAEGQRVDAQGELRWVDEKRVTGGLRFSSMSAETREHIHQLVCQTNPAPADLAAKRKLLSAVAADAPLALEPLRSPSRGEKRQRLGVFARGLLCGLALSAVVASGVLLHMERSHFGEALMKVGGWLAARSAPPAPQAEAPSSPAAVAPGGSVSQNSSSGASGSAKQPEVVVQEPAVIVSGVSPATPMPMGDPRRSPSLISPAPASNAVSGALEPPAETEAGAKLQPNNDAPAAAGSAAERIGNAIPGSSRYLDFREFKQRPAAEKMSDTLGQSGFHASVVHKGHFFMGAYHVMVGPYNSDTEVEKVRNDLESRGFRPESRSRLSRQFLLPAMTLADKDTVVKDCVISWDPNSSAATVTFVKGDSVVMKAQGKWVKRGVSYKLDAVLSDSKNRGPLTLLEIQCRGMNQALVLDAANPVRYFVPPFRASL